jgi:hypothetical protein
VAFRQEPQQALPLGVPLSRSWLVELSLEVGKVAVAVEGVLVRLTPYLP